jgi:KDO2-lipid IV(A) lauroyltransferase
MGAPQRAWVAWIDAWRSAPSARAALATIGLYVAVRLWTLVIGCFPIETNLRTARLLGRLWWLARKKHRDIAMDNLRHALGDRLDERRLRRIARASFEHFAQLYLVELALSPRLINRWSWPRYVELGDIAPALRVLLAGRGAIMLTAHFGNFELLGFTIARLGVPITAVMRPLDNELINAFLVRSRAVGGLRLLYKKGASEAADGLLAAGGTLCFIADQDAGRKGVFADFFGRPASWYKSIGLLAMRHNAPIIVGHAARAGVGYRYRIEVERVIDPSEWEERARPLEWITQAFAGALEHAIRRQPEQYLWAHRRWKSRPRAGRTPAVTASGTAR